MLFSLFGVSLCELNISVGQIPIAGKFVKFAVSSVICQTKFYSEHYTSELYASQWYICMSL